MGQANVAKSPWYEEYNIDLPSCRSGRIHVLDFGDSAGALRDLPQAAKTAEVRELEERPETLIGSYRSLYRRVPVPKAQLSSGTSIPLVGLGTWKAERGQVRSAVHAALKAGYRHIDCASVYQNEEEVGEALQAALRSGAVAREELFICSKLWNSDHAASRVKAACQRSLKALRLDYLDLYLIHWPVTGIPGPELVPSLEETWAAMEQLVRDGLVKAIGVSNFSVAKLRRLLKCATIKPTVVQVEVHPYWRNERLRQWCREQGIHVTAFSPLGSPDSASIFPRKLPLELLKNERVLEIGRRHGKNAGQVLIRWALQNGTSVIPKSTSAARIAGNLAVLDWALTDEDMRELSSFDVQQRMVNGASWLNPRGPYRTMEDLWDEPEDGGVGGKKEVGDDSISQPTTNGPTPQATVNGNHDNHPPTPSCSSSLVPIPALRDLQRSVRLSDGHRMPLLGLGTWKSRPGEVAAAVDAAVRLGYRHLDCAEVYRNEAEIGAALARLFAEGVVRREELFITSKVWNTSHAPQAVERAARRSAKALGVGYLDLYLVHWPVTGNRGPRVEPPLADTWRAMEALVPAGLARSIGVANYSIAKLRALLESATIPPAVCQCEAHPFFPNAALVEFCAARGIHFSAYSPLGSPDSAAELGRAPGRRLLDDAALAQLAAEVGRTPAQIALRWAVQRGTSVLPKSTNAGRIRDNGLLWDWELSPEAVAAVDGIAYRRRMVDGSFWLSPEGPYRTLEDLWDEPDVADEDNGR